MIIYDKDGEELTRATTKVVITAPTYTISYNANGGSGAPSSQTKTYGKDLTLSTTKPTRSGYTFLGWSTSSTATAATYSAGGKYTSNSKATLYAVWKANTYTVKYNANGGSGTMSNSSHTYDISKALTSNAFTRSGYTFLGWSTSSSATNATYTNGQSIKNLTVINSATVNLYAVWSKLPTYTIGYNANGGSGAPPSQTKTKDVTLTLSTTKPTRTGYTFLGWSTSSTATTATYSAGGKYTANSNATLYAVWKKNATVTYTLTYNANGGSGAPSSQSGSESYTISETRPTRSGYTFFGWSESSTATSASYWVGDIITISNDTTLYAVWKLNRYIVSYNANGGSGAPSSQTKNYGKDLTLSTMEPTRSGYTFLGWATNSTATIAAYSAGGKYTENKNTTLYAVWQKNVVEPTPVELPKIAIKRTTKTTINFGDTLVLKLEEIEIPEGYAFEWFVEGAGVSTRVSEDGLECRVTSIANGNAVISAKLVNEDGEALSNADGEAISDEITLTSKAGFWQKFVSFFKNLFGINRIIY